MQASPQYRNGVFEDTLARGGMPFWPIFRQWFVGDQIRVPEQPLPVRFRRAGEFTSSPATGLRVTWLGHSTLLVEIDGHRLLTDPVWSERTSPLSFYGPKRFHPPPLPLAELPSIDAVLISHDHYDHLDQPTIVALIAAQALFFVPLGVGAHLESWGVPAERLRELDWWQQASVGELQVTATPARHFSGRTGFDRDRTLWASWVVRGPRHRFYFSGDTAMFPGFAEIGRRFGPFDAAALEVGAYDTLWADVHLGPEQAVQAHLDLRGGLLIPIHWGTFELAFHTWTAPVERLLTACEQAAVKLVVPRPGESVEPAHPSAVQRWWPALPYQSGREQPVVSSGLSAPPSAKPEAPP